MRRLLLISIGLVVCAFAKAQQFSAFEGSIYSGVLNTPTQPSADIFSPYKWEVQPIAVNAFFNTDVMRTKRTLELPKDYYYYELSPVPGNGKRYGVVRADTRVFNLSYRINKRNFVGGGLNFHGFGSQRNVAYNFADSVKYVEDFLKDNAVDKSFKGTVVNNNWMEGYLNYERLLRDNAVYALSVGANLQLIKGITGGYLDLQKLQFQDIGGDNYLLTQAEVYYGYSSNYGDLSENNNVKGNAVALLRGSKISLGLSFGITYVSKRKAFLPAGFDQPEAADYDWKLDAAITDFGRLEYPYGRYSYAVNGVNNAASLADLVSLFESTNSLAIIGNQLGQYTNISTQKGYFAVSLPTALRVNFDKHIKDNFYINGKLVMDISAINWSADYLTHTLSHLVVTPRWENRWFGLYLPVYLNAHGSAMLGGAIKLGPLMAGVYGFGWLKSGSYINKGGGYISLLIHNFRKKAAECPPVPAY